MNFPLFPTDITPTQFTAIVIEPNGVDCMRKFIPTLYDAKLWITEKIYLNKEKDTEKNFPFGFDYCIIDSDRKVFTPEQINLPERIS